MPLCGKTWIAPDGWSAADQGTVAGQQQAWDSLWAKCSVLLTAIAHGLEGYAIHGTPKAAIGRICQTVFGWEQAGSAAIAQALPVAAHQIGEASMEVSRGGDPALTAAARKLALIGMQGGGRRHQRALDRA